MNLFLFFLFLYICYLYRYSLFIYYCELCCYFESDNSTNSLKQLENDTCILFDCKNFTKNEKSLEYYDNYSDEDKDNIVLLTKNNYYITTNILILTKNNYYMIFPNNNFEIVDSPFIICEITYNNKTYDITNYLKYFCLKNNVILTRPFITYIFYEYLNMKIHSDETYTISYIDTNTDKITINDEDINIYKYTI